MTESAIAKQYQKYLEADAEADKHWSKRDKEIRRLVRLAKLGRKASIVVPISENRGVRITNRFRTREDKVFTPAFCRRFELKEVALQQTE